MYTCCGTKCLFLKRGRGYSYNFESKEQLLVVIKTRINNLINAKGGGIITHQLHLNLKYDYLIIQMSGGSLWRVGGGFRFLKNAHIYNYMPEICELTVSDMYLLVQTRL